MRTKISDALIRHCRENLVNCDVCKCSEEECIKSLYEEARLYFDWDIEKENKYKFDIWENIKFKEN